MSFSSRPVPAIGPQKKAQRRRLGVSVRQLAKQMKISHVYLLDLEKNNRTFTEELQGRYDQALAQFEKPNVRFAR